MPTPTYVPLAQVTTSGSPTSIIFSSIPATYRDLVLVFNGGGVAGNPNIFGSLNSDTTGANYATRQISGSGTASDGATFPDGRILNYWGYASNDLNTILVWQIMDASQTNKNKTWIARSNNAGTGTALVLGRWANNARVTSVRLDVGGPSFVVGSTITLYGIGA
jgi:hypothetical protein